MFPSWTKHFSSFFHSETINMIWVIVTMSREDWTKGINFPSAERIVVHDHFDLWRKVYIEVTTLSLLHLPRLSYYLEDSSFNSPRQKSGLVHKGGGGGTLSPDFSWEPFFGHFLGLFKAFLGLFTTFWPLKNSLESRKGRGGGGGKKVWTSPDFCRGELNDEFP